MPDLPTITVNNHQAALLLEIFGSPEGYLEWLRNTLVEYVVERETRRIDINYKAAREAAIQAYITEILAPDAPEPEEPPS